MTKLLLTLHVIVAIVAVGPVTVAAVLGGIVLAWQRRRMSDLEGPTGFRSGAVIVMPDLRQETVRLAMPTGSFDLMWAAVTALRIIRPGSTTGA